MNKRIPREKAKVLNEIVRLYNMTSKSKVGTVTELILEGDFNSLEEWAEHYYSSGEERISKIEKKKDKEDLTKTKLEKFQRSLKRDYGRSENELEDLGKELNEKIPCYIEKLKKKIEVLENINEEECIKCIKQFVIDNTWEGMKEREKNATEKLKEKLGDKIEDIEKTSGEVDTGYCVDREIVLEEGSRIGLQIKPPRAQGMQLVIQQNKRAQSEYPHEVFIVFAKKNGGIVNEEVIDYIRDKINKKVSDYDTVLNESTLSA